MSVRSCQLKTQESRGQVERALTHVFEFEVRSQHLLIQIVLGLLHFFRIVPPVPGSEWEVAPFAVDHGLHFGHFLFGPAQGRIPDLLEQLVDVVRNLGHVLFEHVVGMRFVAEQFGARGPQHDYFGQNELVVELVVVVAAIDVRQVDLLAKLAPVGILQERNHAGLVQGEDPFPGVTPFLGGFGRPGNHVLGKSGQVGFLVQHQFETILFFQHVLAELHRQDR